MITNEGLQAATVVGAGVADDGLARITFDVGSGEIAIPEPGHLTIGFPQQELRPLALLLLNLAGGQSIPNGQQSGPVFSIPADECLIGWTDDARPALIVRLSEGGQVIFDLPPEAVSQLRSAIELVAERLAPAPSGQQKH
ncbi:hypothetical protein QO010_000761 [Caulobacter ginsengisoli]|uniref:Uncharacterized protein n=1 Tax=Caulobacter ginsengisoli TaxID=400775 RepID=A0ABU0ILW0_9CAUL|nr:hypothetical protein [Caulobacter ginsengisoli]MDQ0463013.1 hypothetical protein [Caulobacter ginsengisoli]